MRRRVKEAPEPLMDTSLLTEEELARLKPEKAPGSDEIPFEALKAMAKTYSQLHLRMYNACLVAGVFPLSWKEARLFLVDKEKGDPGSSSWSLRILDTAEKLLEFVGDLSLSQHGFEKEHSTIDVIFKVFEAAARNDAACHASTDIVLLIMLDGHHPFNSAR